jgi:II/X family phage/plasmid replication protein
MIDWLTCRVPVRLPETIAGGHTLKLDRSGQVLVATPHRLMVEGSFSSSLSIRAPSTSELEISGNVAKWLAGHNLWGTDCPKSLLWAALRRLEGMPGVFPWSLASVGLHGPECLGDTILTRVDCTGMLQLETQADVLAFIRSASATGTLSHRGRGVMREGTLVFGDAKGKSFTRSQIVMYAKGQEVQAHQLPDLMMADPEVLAWVNRCLRVEVRLGRLELQEQGLRLLSGWRESIALHVWETAMAKLSFSEAGDFDLSNLPKKYRGTYAMWEGGHDCRQLLSTPTFYRHRNDIQKLTGIDISVPPAPRKPSNVVPLSEVLGTRWVTRPDWADRIEGQLQDGGAVILPFAA